MTQKEFEILKFLWKESVNLENTFVFDECFSTTQMFGTRDDISITSAGIAVWWNEDNLPFITLKDPQPDHILIHEDGSGFYIFWLFELEDKDN